MSTTRSGYTGQTAIAIIAQAVIRGASNLHVSTDDLRCLELGQIYRYQIRTYDTDGLYNSTVHGGLTENLVYSPANLEGRISWFEAWNWKGNHAIGFDIRPGSREQISQATVIGPGFSYTFDISADWYDISVENYFNKGWWKEFGPTIPYGPYTLTVLFDDGYSEIRDYTLDAVDVTAVDSATMEHEILDDGAIRFTWNIPTTDQKYDVRIRSTDGSLEFYRSDTRVDMTEVWAGSYELRLLQPGETYQWFVRAYDQENNHSAQSGSQFFTWDPFNISPTGAVSGRVTSGGADLEGITVNVYAKKCKKNFIASAHDRHQWHL